MQTINGIIDRVIHRNGSGFIIFNLRQGKEVIPVTGEDQDLHEADVVVCEGDWTQYKGAPQFKAKSIIPQIPSTADAIIAYLASGRIKGISKVFAARLVDTFGQDVLDVIENSPEKLRQVEGFGKKRIKTLTTGLSEQIGYRSILIFLHNFGLPKHLIKRIYNVYGLQSVEKIKQDPYKLCEEIQGMGFAMADRIGLRSGLDCDHPSRIRAGVSYALDASISSSGNTCLPNSELAKAAHKLLSGAGAIEMVAIEAGIAGLIDSGEIRSIDMNGCAHYFPKALYFAEKGIAKHLHRLMGARLSKRPEDSHLNELIDSIEQKLAVTLNEQQRSAVKTALCEPVSIITGGPGTGKTTILKVFIKCCLEVLNVGQTDIALCAPTGKAAKRMNESTQIEAMTIHRLLEFQPVEGEFFHNSENPLCSRVVVADEYSMSDTQLTNWLLQAVPTGARLVLLGDVDQLPSVGPGKVLKDLIDSKEIPVTRLTHIYRQGPDSYISLNAHKMNKGQDMDLSNLGKNSDFWFIGTPNDEESAETICNLVDRVSAHYGFDPVLDVQVLTPMRKGTVGYYELNSRLQKKLNPLYGTGIKLRQNDHEVQFCVGDKVMHTKNNKELGVFNGETGRIVKVNVKERLVTVNYDDRDIEYAFIDLEELSLAYAMTIHKSQGSEFPCVIIPSSTSHYHMLYRSLFYTGITRAKKLLLMVGDKRALDTATRRVESDKRVTGLVKMLVD